MTRSRPYSLRVFSVILAVAGLLFAGAVVVQVISVHQQADLGETSRLESAALMLSTTYVGAVHAGNPTAPLVQGDLPSGLRLTLLNTAGSAVADSKYDPGSVTNRSTDPEVKPVSYTHLTLPTK